jgi:DNA primase
MSAEHEQIGILSKILGHSYISGHERLYHCPRCKHHKRKMSVNLPKDKFKCWICDYAGHSIRRVVKNFGSFSDLRRWDRLTGTVEISLFDRLFGGTELEEPPEPVAMPKEFVSLANRNLPISSKLALKYLYERGVTRQEILKWKIGYCSEGEYAGRIIVPSFSESGDLNFFVGRSYTGQWQKYNQPSVSRDIVFNHLYIDWDEDVILVEGVFDAIVAGSNAIPILGSSLKENSKLFQEIVSHDSTVYVALDPDAERKALRLIRDLLEYDVELYKINIFPYSDVGEMFSTEFEKRKAQAQQMTQDSLLRYRASSRVK